MRLQSRVFSSLGLMLLLATASLPQQVSTERAAAPLSGLNIAPTPVPCQTVGQIFGWDFLEHRLTLKSDSGHFSDFGYDNSTAFTDGEANLSPEQLNIDDRLCVEAFRPGSQEIASHVRVTLRSEIDARNKQELLRWQAESVFGVVKSLDSTNHRITLGLSASPDVLVDAAGHMAFWILPAAALDPGDAMSGRWEDLATGDAIYVRGDRVPGTRTIRARLIVSGGFRSFAGSVESKNPLTSVLRLRDFRSGRSHAVHFEFMPIYVVGRSAAPGARDRRLYVTDIGDLKEGDSVLIMGRESPETGGSDAFLLITGFSAGGVVQPGPGQTPDWIFQAVGFGEHRL